MARDSQERQKYIGALWENEGEYGPYMNGVIEVDGKKVNFVCYRRKVRQNDKAPHWNIVEPRKRGRQPGEDDEDPPA